MPQMNFDEIKAPELVPAGMYLAEIVHSEEATSQKGNTMFKLRWQIIVDTEGGQEQANRVVFDNLVFAFDSESPVPLQRIKECLTACGWSDDFDGSVEAEELVGKVALVSVGIRQSDDINPATGQQYDPQNNIRNYRTPGQELMAMAV